MLTVLRLMVHTFEAGRFFLLDSVSGTYSFFRYQSHERVNINQALKDGFQLQVRVLSCGKTGSTAENMEKRALKAFSYEWNDMNQKS